MSITISDSDIDRVQDLLFPGIPAFDAERRTFLRCLDSVDVQACPGSGKTTLLVAKLLILASKFPLPNNGGICVLTHTNTAVDQIKRKFSPQSEVIFRYPNFVGTIQSFIDKFLATPYYVSVYGHRPIRIDDESFNYEIQKDQGRDIKKLRGWLARQQRLLIQDLRFSFESMVISGSLMNETPFVGEDSDSYKQAKAHKLAVLKKGHLCFDDAYAIANRYLLRFPSLTELMCQRFRYVFVDEMQDTDLHQLRILEKVFPKDRTIVQYIGDPNQSIYSSDVHENLVWQIDTSHLLGISGTKRMSQDITDVVQRVAIQPQELSGIVRQNSVKPKIFLFRDEHILRVIPTFCNLISELKLDNDPEIPEPIFKVVGWVGKENNLKHTLASYWPGFNQKRLSNRSPSTWNDHVYKLKYLHAEEASVYRETIIEAIIAFLRLVQIRKQDGAYYTSIELLELLKSDQPLIYDELRLCLATWAKALHKDQSIDDELQTFLANQLLPIFLGNRDVPTREIGVFFDVGSSSVSTVEVASPDVDNPIKFQVETIHAVKGQNHTATLFVETFFYEYDINKILPVLDPTTSLADTVRDTRTVQAMKMSYVAMSRPTHLLCLAIHLNTQNGRSQSLIRDVEDVRARFGNQWEIIELLG